MLIGASVVLAGQALRTADPPPSGGVTPIAGSPTASAIAQPTPVRLPDAPTLDPPATRVVTMPTIEVSGRLPAQLERDGRYRLRLYVNGELVHQRRLPRRDTFTFGDTELREGLNSITAAINGPAGESLHSAAIEILLDTIAPTITIAEPGAGPIFTAEVLVRGTSEPGATLSLTNIASSIATQLVIGPDGSFEFSLPLALGTNELQLEARDGAGHVDQATLVLLRLEGNPSVELSLSRGSVALSALPTSVTLRAQVRDPAGAPIDGAEVTFSISPPGLSTLTYQTTTQAGSATWSGIRISSGAQRGLGLVTVLVVLPSGETLQESAEFTIE